MTLAEFTARWIERPPSQGAEAGVQVADHAPDLGPDLLRTPARFREGGARTDRRDMTGTLRWRMIALTLVFGIVALAGLVALSVGLQMIFGYAVSYADTYLGVGA